jgi:NodT family efflux transporter outer membrane factor (OMF) lipoprotein
LNIGSAGRTITSSLFNLFTISSSVSYALDVFGGQRRLVEELHAESDVAHEEAQATYLTLATNVANIVIAAAACRAEIEATQQLVELQKQQVDIASVQARTGTVPYSSVLSPKSQLAAYEAMIPQFEQTLAQSDDLLAALAGHVPAEYSQPAVRLDDLVLPRKLPLSLPSDLVRQRPDILAAEATAHAASANIGVATAAMLPSVTLGGGIGASTTTLSNLVPANGHAWSLGAGATTPLFEGGTLWFKRKAAIDDYQQAIALYRQTVIRAFEQVADTLRALDHDAQILAAEDQALSSAAQGLNLVQANYEASVATYLDVLIRLHCLPRSAAVGGIVGRMALVQVGKIPRFGCYTNYRWRCSTQLSFPGKLRSRRLPCRSCEVAGEKCVVESNTEHPKVSWAIRAGAPSSAASSHGVLSTCVRSRLLDTSVRYSAARARN